MSEKKDWKETLLMPKTDFEMKANLTTKEKIYRKEWEDKEIYQKALKQNKENDKGTFILHDGPPYANGNIHVGHALNKILKDIIVRRKTMEGYYSPYVSGWDTHGLPIENKMLEEMKMTKEDLDKVVLRKEAAKYANKQIKNQMEQFKQLQLFSDFKKIYKTLDPSFEVGQLKLFKKMALEGLIYKGLKPVYWSPSSISALAEAEVEYQDIRSPQVIIAFTIKEGNEIVKEGTELLIMTTTPWTIPANSGVAVGPSFNYDIVLANNKEYIIASDLVSAVVELVKWEEYKIIKTIKGNELIGLKYTSPINNLIAPVIEGHHVTTDAGTGLVHMAPLFGEDDYIIGKENNLEMIMHVNAKGIMTKEAGKYEGKFYADASKDIGLDLEQRGKLLSLKFVKHSYPHDWRTHQPVIYRGVPQWFVNIEKIKDDILKELKNISSTPEWGIKRIADMIENRTEWTISRQRTWGVPIIIFYNENNEPQYNEEIFDYVISLVAKDGTDIWWEKETDELLPEKYRGRNWTREMDIMDVWFDSGSSSIAVDLQGNEAPFDLYLEGSDQYRGWFNSSLINSVAYRKKAPFKHLLSHGFVLDGKQQKMSKSKGNVVDPLTIINKNGADILRLWVSNTEYTSDVTISDEILKQNIEIYRRIRNTFRFMLGNLNDFDYKNDKVSLEGIHKFINNVVNNYKNNINKLYDKYKFQEIIKETNKLLIDLSGWYFDYAKDILYCDKKNSLERRSIQTNIFEIINIILESMAPIIPTTCEEVYKHLKVANKKESLFLTRVETNNKEIDFDQKMVKFFNTHRDLANKELEKARKEGIIKRNNEAILLVDINEEDRITDSETYSKYFMVAKVEFGDHWGIKVFESKKCTRCWNHFEQLNENNICDRCKEVVS